MKNAIEEIVEKLSTNEATKLNMFLKGMQYQKEKMYSNEDIAPLLEFINDCDFNWDCDSDSHRYNTNCRCCDAKRILEQFKKK